MITALSGPLVVEPEWWTVVFHREAATRWASWLAWGKYKHVSAYAYVPFLHVWVFYDVQLAGVRIVLAADGPPAHEAIQRVIAGADLVKIRRRPLPNSPFLPPLAGWCVPSIRRLLGVSGCALRPDGFYRDCLANGGVPFETRDEHSEIPAAGDGPDVWGPDAAEPAAGYSGGPAAFAGRHS